MTGVLLLTILAAAQSPSDLIDGLRDPDIERRDAADLAIRKLGRDAIPALERALKHDSPEIRTRAAAILDGFPEYALKSFLADPELRDVWTAVVDTLVHKRPIPSHLCSPEELNVQEVKRQRILQDPIPTPHPLAWIREHMLSEALKILPELARTYGIEGSQNRHADILMELRAAWAGRVDLLPALVRLNADAVALEEVYATVRLLRRTDMNEWFAGLHDDDWETVLRYLVHIRRTPGAPTAALPKTMDEAWAFIEKGPWLAGIADGLGRAFANRARIRMQMAIGGLHQVGDAVEASPLATLYEALFTLDEDLGKAYWHPRLLAPADPRLPPETGRLDVQGGLLDELRNRKPTADELRVIREIAPNLFNRELGETGTPIQARLLHRLAARVVADVQNP